ncbi:MAG TPA: alpha/beta fold hydrolase, partial [Planctomycetota bacterium]|nr:alpha/beta fold hydrolase [Planctomycetota bacterium]
ESHGGVEGGGGHALAAAAFAWEFLFADAPGRPPDPWDPHFRVAGDFYSRALLEAFRERPERPEIRLAGGARSLPVGSMEIALDPSGVAASLGSGLVLYAADEYDVRGIRARQRRGGIGLPLVAKPPALVDQAGHVPGAGLLYSGRAAFAATAVLRLEGGLDALVEGRPHAMLSLLASDEVAAIRVGERAVPLAADFSAPYALALESSRVWDFEMAGFLSGEEEFRPGLIPTTPYRPGRIPVVLVHGTASSPARWAEMLNTLYGEEALRDRYQFWLFIYSTGNPVPYSANLLRKSLAEAVRRFDPEGKDEALRRMVLVGHSQGGLLCRMAASSTGDFLVAGGRGLRIEDIELAEKDMALFRECLRFRASPTVTRVVFLCTPHGGSYVAGGVIGAIGSSMAGFGGRLLDLARKPFRLRSGKSGFPHELDMPTSVDNMAPGSPFLQSYAAMEPGPGVVFHNIIAVKGAGDPRELNDGVVSWAGAHMPEAASEFVVRWGHSCQSHPLVIEEVRRILVEHAGQATQK